jgi:MFS family permease
MKRAVVLYFAADFTSLLGNSAIGLALPWLVLLRTGDAAAAGLVAAATAAPAFLAAVLGGSLVDRVGRRTITIVADVGSAVSVALLFIVDDTVGLTLLSFIALGLLGALFDVPGITARQAMLPEIARAGGMTLDRASGIRQALFGASFLLGPALAGLALALLPPSAVLLITVGCSALAAVLTIMLPRPLGGRAPAERQHPVEYIREGFTILGTNPVARALTILGITSVFAISPLQAVVLPVVFQRLDQPALLGLTLSVFAVGLIGGSLVYGGVSARLGRRAILVVALLSSLVGLCGLAVAPGAGVIVASAPLVGVGYGLLNPMLTVLIAERVPERLRGRVLGLQNAGYLAAFPLGALLVGFVTQHAGVQLGAAVSAAAWAACVMYGLSTPALRELRPPDRRTPTADEAASG